MKELLFFSFFIFLFSCKEETTAPISLSAPEALDASDVTNESFTANWNNSSGANDYELDIATDADFSTIVESKKNLAPSSTLVDALSGNTKYFYRVRATLNGGDASKNSNVISVFTLPDAPIAAEATNISNSGFTANWNEVAGITNYLVYVSLNNFPADPPNNLPGYNGKEVTGTSFEVIGLNSGTIYYYVVKAKIDERISTYSNSIEIWTSN